MTPIQISNTKDQKYQYVKMLIMGESGVGKTRFLGTVPEDEILLINILSESGTLTLRDKSITTIDVDSYDDMIEAIEWIKKNGSKYNYVAIDSLSQWQKNMETQLRKEFPNPKKDEVFTIYRKLKNQTKEIVDYLKKLPFHVICTCEIAPDKDDDSGAYLYKPSMVGSAGKDITFWFDEVYYFLKRQASLNDPVLYSALTTAGMKYPCKSRLDLPPIIDNPNLAKIIKDVFGDLDKSKQESDLKEVVNAEAGQDQYRKKMLADIRALADTREFDRKKFHTQFKTGGSVDDIQNDYLEDALLYIRDIGTPKKVEVKK